MHVTVCGELDVVHVWVRLRCAFTVVSSRVIVLAGRTVVRAPRAFGCAVAGDLVAACYMRTCLMMRSLHQRHETPVFTESPVSPPSPWSQVSSDSPPDTVWYDSDVACTEMELPPSEHDHCVSGDATSTSVSR